MDNEKRSVPLPENHFFSEIFKELFPDVELYECDVPQNFVRPCFLFINPDKRTRSEPLTRAIYKMTREYEIYGYCKEDDTDKLEEYKDRVIDYLMAEKKIRIPGTDRFFTVEDIAADTDDVQSLIGFIVKVSEIRGRNIRKEKSQKINVVERKIIVK